MFLCLHFSRLHVAWVKESTITLVGSVGYFWPLSMCPVDELNKNKESLYYHLYIHTNQSVIAQKGQYSCQILINIKKIFTYATMTLKTCSIGFRAIKPHNWHSTLIWWIMGRGGWCTHTFKDDLRVLGGTFQIQDMRHRCILCDWVWD